jgi:hypothetical protein
MMMNHHMTNVLNAIADTLQIKLQYDTKQEPLITGETERYFTWFGDDQECVVRTAIVDAMIIPSRDLTLVIAHFTGNLYACVMSDGQKDSITLFILDGSKIGLAGGEHQVFFPKQWLREDIYRLLVDGVKATFQKKFYDKAWTMLERGNKLMPDYIANKEKLRAVPTKPALPVAVENKTPTVFDTIQ